MYIRKDFVFETNKSASFSKEFGSARKSNQLRKIQKQHGWSPLLNMLERFTCSSKLPATFLYDFLKTLSEHLLRYYFPVVINFYQAA